MPGTWDAFETGVRAIIGQQVSVAGANTLIGRLVASDAVRLDRSVGLDDLVASITHIPGLGPWTAHYIALRLGERDAFPAADLGLQRQLAETAGRSTAAVTAFSERWRPWRALAATHLWMADLPKQKDVTSSRAQALR